MLQSVFNSVIQFGQTFLLKTFVALIPGDKFCSYAIYNIVYSL
ncbi:hypothetical protein LPE509_02363 [Legionella pneumophila subsp. pneumophila LPE509]|nr:hypothetical protein LPE509_02363 [Legionella pneumophila subsp. pneumophila LPE509]